MRKTLKIIFKNANYTFKSNNSDYTFSLYFVSKILNPILQLLFFYYIQRYVRQKQNIDIYVIGNLLLLSIPNAIFSLARVLTYERDYGTLKLIELVSQKKYLIYFSRAFFYIIEGMGTVLLALLFSICFLKLKISINDCFKLLLIIVATNFSVMGFGMFIGSFGLLSRSILFLVNTSYLILIGLSGANYSIDLFPTFVKNIIIFLPLQRGIKAAFFLYNTSCLNLKLIAFELLIGIFYYSIGYFFINFLSKKAKLKDTFDLF